MFFSGYDGNDYFRNGIADGYSLNEVLRPTADGGAGNDWLIGAKANDNLRGGNGHERFWRRG